ncbi:trehalose-phosphatase [Celerinatantimonas yamalensis]|uniref:Trehalose 6-phosphate phosphatase n=1 Tax=Celerinatantimonas yamalensis TaxID=559956 RepID=A0ABW9G376_9GAMM
MLNDLPELNFGQSAIFLDFDGTLVDLQSTPDAVIVGDVLKKMLFQLDQRTHQSLAIISGRSIASLDQLLAIANLRLGGSHGMEYRLSSGASTTIHPDVVPIPEQLVKQCQSFCQKHQLLWESKPLSAAIHYRDNPKLEADIDDYLTHLICHDPNLEIQRGKFIRELKPKGISKASALEIFMAKPPFYSKIPWYFGDDITDEDAFSWINQHGGVSVKIGDGETLANYHLPTPQHVLNYFLSNLHSEE